MTAKDQEQVRRIMEGLRCTEAEALKVYEADREIDKGAKLFELSAEEKKASKQARQAPRKPTAYNFDTSKRQRKADNEKSEVIQILVDALQNNGADMVEVTNAEREFTFVFKNRKLKITLSAPRT